MVKKSTADRISGLPDEILHCILSRIKPRRKAAQTITLSRRWRNLWRLYPFVHFSKEDGLWLVNFQKFGKDTIERFSRYSFLRMETLNIFVSDYELYLPAEFSLTVFNQLLDLASERKAEEVNISAWRWSFPFQLLMSNSAAKILRIEGVMFSYNEHCDDLPLSLNSSLRVLHLNRVSFDDGRLLENLVASSPLLETLEIEEVYGLSELKVSTHNTNLKTLRIAGCFQEEIEIAAPGLQTLRPEDLYDLSKFELIAPQLNLLEITRSHLTDHCFDRVISTLKSLKSLTINVHDPELRMKLKLLIPKLERG